MKIIKFSFLTLLCSFLLQCNTNETEEIKDNQKPKISSTSIFNTAVDFTAEDLRDNLDTMYIIKGKKVNTFAFVYVPKQSSWQKKDVPRRYTATIYKKYESKKKAGGFITTSTINFSVFIHFYATDYGYVSFDAQSISTDIGNGEETKKYLTGLKSEGYTTRTILSMFNIYYYTKPGTLIQPCTTRVKDIISVLKYPR